MKAARLRYLILALVTTWFEATAVHATDVESPVGLWKGEDATFEMFESDGKLSAKIVALSEPKTSEGKEKTDISQSGSNETQPSDHRACIYKWLREEK